MNKTEVYSWRLDPELKQRLEHAACAEKTSIGSLLERIARDWLGRQTADEDDEALQRRLHAEARKWIGSISSGDPYGSEQVKERVRKYIEQKHTRRAARRKCGGAHRNLSLLPSFWYGPQISWTRLSWPIARHTSAFVLSLVRSLRADTRMP